MSTSHLGKPHKQTSKRTWWLLAVLAVIAFLLGSLGHYEYLMQSNLLGFLDPRISKGWNAPYYALEMLILKSAYLDQPVPLSLVIGRYLAAGVFCYATFSVIFLFFHKSIRNLGRVSKKDHVVICGLGRLGLPLALEAKKRKERVVVIAKNPDGEGVAETIRNRIKVVFGEAGEAETLQQANAGTARSVFAVCPDDQTNIAIAAQIGNLDVKPRSTSRPECWMYISNPKLRSALERHSFLPHHGTQCSVNVRGLAINDLSARRAFLQLPLDHLSLPSGSGRRPRLILIGFDEMGQSLALQAARIAHFPCGGRLEITVVDERVDEQVDSFLHSYPNMKEIADIEKISGTLESFENQRKVLETIKAFEARGELLACAVCHEDENSRNVIFALDLANANAEGRAPILVYLTTNFGFGQLIKSGAPCATDSRLIPFGMIEDIWTLGTLIDEEQDKLARAWHEAYPRDGIGQNRPADKPWEQLDETYRESNRAAADHVSIKLFSIGLERRLLSECGENAVKALNKDQIELLSKTEHARWCAERWLAGWKWAEKRDNDKKLHPDLKPWDELAESEKHIDVKLVSQIFAALDTIGQGAVPVSVRNEADTTMDQPLPAKHS